MEENWRGLNSRLYSAGQHWLQTRLKERYSVIMEAGAATFQLVQNLSQKQGVVLAALNSAKMRKTQHKNTQYAIFMAYWHPEIHGRHMNREIKLTFCTRAYR